jgi:SnoaL-like domain
MAKTLDERMRAIEDIREIMNLKARYLNASDGGWNRPSHDADALASMFTKDGSWQAEGFPRLDGREAIRSAFKQFSVLAPFAFHTVSNPLIEIDGDSATGEWHLTEMFTDASGSEFWAAGIYADRFVRSDEGWRFKSLVLTYAFNGPYKNGWAGAIRSAKGVP